jgi:hypothetical protein
MIERKDKFIRIRVIGGSGIFDSIVNILKKPIVSKLLTSAGKSVASVLGERLVNRMMPPPAVAPTTQQIALPQQQVAQQVLPEAQPVLEVTQPPLQSSRRAQELIERYKVKHTPQVSQTVTPQVTSGTGIPAVPQGVPTIQEYVKRGATRSGKKGAGIKEIL